MDKKFLLLRPLAAWMIVAGLLTLITTVAVTFIFEVLSSIVGFISLLFLVFLAAYEMATFRTIWIAQVGEWANIIKAIGVSVLVRAVLLSLTYSAYGDGFTGSDRVLLDSLFLLNVASILIEAGGLAFIFMKKEYFLPSQAEIEAVMRRLRAVGTTTVADCPNCKQVVEADWCCCPTCGTKLPKFCAECKAEVQGDEVKCLACGAEIVKAEAIENLVRTMKDTAEQPAMPETRSVRYARYAEALLKGGYIEEAVEAYRKAIHYTKFVRKQTNFLVKMATVYKNSGKQKEAAELLKAAIELDAEDIAGAKMALENLFTPVEEGKCSAVKA